MQNIAKRKWLLAAVVITMFTSNLSATEDVIPKIMQNGGKSSVIPNDIQWPIAGKGVQDTSIFFNSEDSVESREADRHNCSNRHFLKHAGHDIIAKYNTAVRPVDDGYIVRIGSGGGWKNFIVVEHNNNGHKWTSVYWHLQGTKGLISTKSSCSHRTKGNTKAECKVNRDSILGYIDYTTNMKDVDHLHLGIRPLKYDGNSKRGFGGCSYLYGFVNPLDYLPHNHYILTDDTDDTRSKRYNRDWKTVNNLDMYNGIGYMQTSKYWLKSVGIPYSKNVNFSGNYNIYVKFPVQKYKTSDRSRKVYYFLLKNKKIVGMKSINQSNLKHRAQNVFLFDVKVRKNDRLSVFILNRDNGKFMSSDALLFVKK